MSAAAAGWLVAVAVALAPEGAAAGVRERAPTTWRPPARAPAGCAIGASGPTLSPQRAARSARRAALRNLALASHALRVRSETWNGAGRPHTRSRQHGHGRVAGASIAALWSARTEVAGRTRDEVFALACRADAIRSFTTPLRLGPTPTGRACAIGLAGPTRDPDHQQAALVADARAALADGLESVFRFELEDDQRGAARVSTSLVPTPDALALASGATLQASWTDHLGEGPLRRPGVVYGRVCTADGNEAHVRRHSPATPPAEVAEPVP